MTQGTRTEQARRHVDLAERFLSAWNDQDVERVVACYTPDLVYRDPNTRGEVHGRDALRRYLAKLFATWQMHWETREAPYGFEAVDGSAALWHASLSRKGETQTIEIDGMDFVQLEGDLMKRNEVYYDRAALLPLMGK
jgi:ketosteroid isomerase-like protein